MKKNFVTNPESLILFGLCGAVFFSPVSISFSTVFAYIAFAAALFSGRIFALRHLWLRSKWFSPVLALIALPWLGMLYAEDARIGLNLAGKTHYWLLAFAAVPLASHRDYSRAVVKSFVLGISLTSVAYLLQFTGMVPLIEDNRAEFIKYITYSLFLVFGMLLLIFLAKEKKGIKAKLPLLFPVPLLFLNLIFLPGRAGYLAFGALLPLMLFILFGRKHVLKAVIVCVLSVGAMFSSPMVRGRVAEGIRDIKVYESGEIATSMGKRFHMWKGALKIISENPVIGAGTGSYEKLMEKYDVPSLKGYKPRHPHNTFLYMLSSFGLVGPVVIIWFFASVLIAGWRGRSTLRGFALFSYSLVMVVGSFTDTQIIQPHSALLMAVFTGLGGTVVQEAECGHSGESLVVEQNGDMASSA